MTKSDWYRPAAAGTGIHIAYGKYDPEGKTPQDIRRNDPGSGT
jgi:hypothetical protein